MNEYLNETRLCWVRPVAASGAADDEARADEFIVLEVASPTPPPTQRAAPRPLGRSILAQAPTRNRALYAPSLYSPAYSLMTSLDRFAVPCALILGTHGCSRFMATISS